METVQIGPPKTAGHRFLHRCTRVIWFGGPTFPSYHLYLWEWLTQWLIHHFQPESTAKQFKTTWRNKNLSPPQICIYPSFSHSVSYASSWPVFLTPTAPRVPSLLNWTQVYFESQNPQLSSHKGRCPGKPNKRKKWKDSTLGPMNTNRLLSWKFKCSYFD